MPDGDEHALDRDLAQRPALHVAQADPAHRARLVLAQDLLDHLVPEHLDLGMAEQPVLQHLLGAQLVAAVDQRDRARHLAEVEGFLDRGVAAADHGHRLVAKEEPVTGRAGRDAVAGEGLLARQAQPAGLGAGREDQALGQEAVAGIRPARERPAREVDLDDAVEHQLRAAVGCLGRHLLHQPRPLDDLGEARIVLDVGRDRELAADPEALDQDRLQIGAGGVDRRGVAGRPGPDDQHLAVACRRHGSNSPALSAGNT